MSQSIIVPLPVKSLEYLQSKAPALFFSFCSIFDKIIQGILLASRTILLISCHYEPFFLESHHQLFQLFTIRQSSLEG